MARRLHPLEIAEAYMAAKEWVIKQGFYAEIDWQADVSLASLTESSFLREAAWVVLNAGFREAVLRSRFPAITSAFLNWSSAKEISTHRVECRRKALMSFRHKRKIDAILKISDTVYLQGFQRIRQRLSDEPLDFIRTLPYIGPVTSYHLAKNLGLPVAKPDRHLVRIAKACGYESVQALCADVGHIIGDTVAVVDLVFWRYATLNPHYQAIFAE
jgi:hypothetical protein